MMKGWLFRMKGTCLCGDVQFEVRDVLPDFYQCHCSLCRKLSGSASDTATFLNKSQFAWVKGESNIRSYQMASGYRSDFCSTCGSTVPHLMENGAQYWIPAGLLDDTDDSQVVAHLYVESKASWDAIGDGGTQYQEMPDITELNRTLHHRIRSSGGSGNPK